MNLTNTYGRTNFRSHLKHSTPYFILTLAVTFIFFVSLELNLQTVSYLWEGIRDGFPEPDIYAALYGYDWWSLFLGASGNYVSMMTWGPSLFQLFIPVFISFVGINIYLKKNCIFFFQYYRHSRYSTFIFKSILWESFKVSISVFFGYLLFYLFTFFIGSEVSVNDFPTGVPTILFLEWFPQNFFIEHCRFFFLLWGIFIFFFLPFIYGIAYGYVALYLNNYVLVCISFFLYFCFMAATISNTLPNDIFIRFMLDPSVIIASSGFTYPNTLTYLSALLIPISVSIFFGVLSWYHHEI